jgi:hypothetical protein
VERNLEGIVAKRKTGGGVFPLFAPKMYASESIFCAVARVGNQTVSFIPITALAC